MRLLDDAGPSTSASTSNRVPVLVLVLVLVAVIEGLGITTSTRQVIVTVIEGLAGLAFTVVDAIPLPLALSYAARQDATSPPPTPLTTQPPARAYTHSREQGAYDRASRALSNSLDRIESILASNRFLLGDKSLPPSPAVALPSHSRSALSSRLVLMCLWCFRASSQRGKTQRIYSRIKERGRTSGAT